MRTCHRAAKHAVASLRRLLPIVVGVEPEVMRICPVPDPSLVNMRPTPRSDRAANASRWQVRVSRTASAEDPCWHGYRSDTALPSVGSADPKPVRSRYQEDTTRPTLLAVVGGAAPSPLAFGANSAVGHQTELESFRGC